MNAPKNILVLRFSSLGDIAMTVPVLKNLLHQHPLLNVTIVSPPFFEPLFKDIERLKFYPADVKNEFKGLAGIYALSCKIKKDIKFDAIADLHDSLRTKLLRILLPGKAAVINKGRKEKKQLTRKKNKILRPLKSTFERYAEVFGKLGLTSTLDIQQGIKQQSRKNNLLPQIEDRSTWIGVAPFAKHAPKQYPLDKMEELVSDLASLPGTAVILSGGNEESPVLERWAEKYQAVYSIAGKFQFEDQLNIISQLDLMISMDSANMHLASLFGVPVVSIWGGTHPFAGFNGWGQSMDNTIQADLPCRPSSVFGNKPCPVHGNSGCMEGITPEIILDQVKKVLHK